ncbi:hypothetical protein VOLCADRAFT_86295 [Volvox carteri f. nagariensis]|uniref:Reverse transcriptase domain-containing protein n=1 Tax=Volvox carteri f. nagariensis TaxID=3068 RepID=D8TIE5_VOLCA|nr:uncharacterized protein VOLCADRAFT_86295 [Volvox carteri f. nagariensis]EFJ53226.1 hypothetical protein VOLCADRAFT_86295 [Volvox carteri f. nagariensis]|eukprot:XP_002946231.1 hypothetical protein VOLCADRAFT_86295 [Volvox carteri f. nagariensis]
MFTPKQGAIGGRSRTSRLRVTANYSWPCLLGPRETPSLQQYMHNVFFPVSQTGRPSRPGARVLPYLDDFLIMFTSEEQARFCARWVREMIEFLGLSCHPTKCQWEPSQSVYHLGITVNTAAGVFEVTKQKLAKLWWLAIGLRITAKKNQRLVQKCELAKFCSFAQSIKLALTPALLFLRNCYDDVKQPVWQCGCSRSVGAFAWHSVGQCGGAIAGSCAPEPFKKCHTSSQPWIPTRGLGSTHSNRYPSKTLDPGWDPHIQTDSHSKSVVLKPSLDPNSRVEIHTFKPIAIQKVAYLANARGGASVIMVRMLRPLKTRSPSYLARMLL